MSKRRRTFGETMFRIMGLILAGSMIISLVVVALPGPATPTPAPTTPVAYPTFTPFVFPTDTPAPPPSPTLELLPTWTPTTEPTESPAETPAITVTLEITPPVIGPELPTETPEPTPAGADAPPPAGETLTFAVAGDSRDGPQVYRRVLEAVAADGSAFLIHTGDLVNKGTEAQWQEFEALMADFALPFYPVPGNHDGLDGELVGYLQYSGATATHYSFDYGPVHLTLADSHNGGIGAGELAWLREDLRTTDQPLKMVVLHHPPFDPDGTDHIMAYGNDSFMDLMAEMDVDYVFAGHIHAYARGERDGVTYVITGGAGAPLYAKDHPHSFHHYLRVTVQGTDVSLEIVEV